MANYLVSHRLRFFYQLLQAFFAAEFGLYRECSRPPSVVPAHIPADKTYLHFLDSCGF